MKLNDLRLLYEKEMLSDIGIEFYSRFLLDGYGWDDEVSIEYNEKRLNVE